MLASDENDKKLLLFADVQYHFTDYFDICEPGVDVACCCPSAEHRSLTKPSLSLLSAISAFALSSVEPKTGTSHRWSLCFIGSDTHILP